MENRTLIIGDELFGDQGEAAHRCAEIILCREANRPIQFSINAPVAQSLAQLRARVSTDVIGKKPGRIVLGLGLKDLNRGGVDYKLVFEQYSQFVDDILNKTTSPVHLLTIPTDMLPTAMAQLVGLNELIRGLQEKPRVSVFDFAAYADIYKEKQVERGKFGRSIYTEDGKPTSLCNTLLALFLQECILKELK
ncbi:MULTISPECIES: SGNH/GDSL hydrolase family protein [unclassified Fibrobacter]|uniref:SGNH/GDSL hydrolase family protein n=1 Tax=unclassified Fibrobacter TaxID=2634177 RepID=UPI000D6D86ED|nr:MULTISPECIES: SGNH/GDSL hydrolase family protein [unclassified Fibrobacter]PWJ68196.1 hypothetical protein BGX12_10916 [Fibrobacter sp. UWR4]PZW72554.1 hypothetical protein C8E88_100616 [Fibrobacter sp. UWR1]